MSERIREGLVDGGKVGERGKMGEGGEREWLGCYYSSRRVGTQSAARREAHCAGV